MLQTILNLHLLFFFHGLSIQMGKKKMNRGFFISKFLKFKKRRRLEKNRLVHMKNSTAYIEILTVILRAASLR